MMGFFIQKAYAVGSFPGSENTTGSFPGSESTSGIAFNSLLQKILTNIVNPIVYLLMALAVVYFVWGVVVFIQNADQPEKRKEGYQHMIWGIIGLFIMVSAKGIINLILSTMGL